MFLPRASSCICLMLLAGIPACTDELAPSGQPQLTIEFQMPEIGADPPSVDATAVEQGIRITGRLLLPSPCYSATDTALIVDERDLSLQIRVTAHQGACFDAFTNMHFEALIRNLTPDRYNLEVQLHRDTTLQMRYAETLLVAGGL